MPSPWERSFLLLAADHRVGAASGDYTIKTNEVAIGLTMPRWVTRLLQTRLVSTHLARTLLLAQRWSLREPTVAGFLDELAHDTIGAAQQSARALLDLDPRALVATKRRLWGPVAAELRRSIELDQADLEALASRRLQVQGLGTDAAEGVAGGRRQLE